MRRKQLVKISSPPLHFTFNKKKMKSFEKVKLCWIFVNVPNENCSLFTEKKTKSRRENEPKNPPKNEQGKGK